MTFVSRIQDNLAAGLPKEAAVEEAVNFSSKHNLLNGFFHEQKMEVLNMSLFEFDQEEYDRNRFEEGKAVGVLEGKEEGERNKALQDARNFIRLGIPLEQIAQGTELPLELITELQKEMSADTAVRC